MKKENNDLLEKVRKWVTAHFLKSDSRKFTYHNLDHIEEVSAACQYLADFHQINEIDKEILLVSAWFHDTGCWEDVIENHEEKSVLYAKTFFEKFQIEGKLIDKVESCILATRMPQHPKGILEKIICDADLSHFAKDGFVEKSKSLYKEMVEFGKYDKSETEWLKETYLILKNHKYHTEIAQKEYEKGKLKNLDLLQHEIQRKQEKKAAKQARKDLKMIKKNLPERGVETMFRTTSKNHLELSSIADNKANIMISVNSIIVSIIVTVLIRKLEEQPQFIIPTILLLLTNLVTIVFAVLATRPKVTEGNITQKDIDNKKSNLLYFGNFHKMDFETYESGMKTMMQDADFLYSTMIRDIYYLGIVLNKKYTLLRKSYNVFMYGFIISALGFALTLIIGINN
ncbi:Pycsar system effector family protein [Aquiflexum sp.]|uniref:Pycsar system effector family protein n=1 Tax=Aquiflexum sp. TaxID=1872584 RepID=UPI00359376FB